jgi:hypothetical protein
MNLAMPSPTIDRRLEKFFRAELLPLARQYKREGRCLLAGNPDGSLSSYYEQRKSTRMSRSDFEKGSCRSTEELAAELEAMWRQQGFDELAALAPQLAKLAERLRQTQPETEDVSPFVYAMY